MSDPISLSINAADDSSSVTLKSLSIDEHHVDEVIDCEQLVQHIQESHLNGITDPIDPDMRMEVNDNADGNGLEGNERLSSVTDVPVAIIESSESSENAVASAVADATSIENIFFNDQELNLLTSDEVMPAESLSNGPVDVAVAVTKKQYYNQEELNMQIDEESIKSNHTNGLIQNLTVVDKALLTDASSNVIDLMDNSVINISNSVCSLDDPEAVINKGVSVINEEFSKVYVTKETSAFEVIPKSNESLSAKQVTEDVAQTFLKEDEQVDGDLKQTSSIPEDCLLTKEAKKAVIEDESTLKPVELVREVVSCSSLLENVSCEEVSLVSEMIQDSPIIEKASTNEGILEPVTCLVPDSSVKEDPLKIPDVPVSPLEEDSSCHTNSEPNLETKLSENISLPITSADNDTILFLKDVSINCSSDEKEGHEKLVNHTVVERTTEIVDSSITNKLSDLGTEDTNEISVVSAEAPAEPIIQEYTKDENKPPVTRSKSPITKDLLKDDSVDTDVLQVIEEIDPLSSINIEMQTIPEILPSVPATQTASVNDDVVMLLTDSDDEPNSPGQISKPDVAVVPAEIDSTKIEHVEPVTSSSTTLPSSSPVAASNSSVVFEPVAGPSGLQAGKQTVVTEDDIIMLDDDDDDIPIPPPPANKITEIQASINVTCKYLF